MRAIFFLLLLANALAFAWLSGYIGKSESATPGPVRQADVSPERMVLLPPREAAQLVQAAKAEQRRVCLEWGSFGQADADRVALLMESLSLGSRLTVRKVEETAGFWVFFPPQGTKVNAEKKVDEARTLGVKEYFIISETGANQWAISLGVFKTEEAARNYLADLTKLGVTTARIAARPTTVTKTIFQMRELDTRMVARFEDWKKDFPNQELSECAAGARP